jgi:hypothetical protein
VRVAVWVSFLLLVHIQPDVPLAVGGACGDVFLGDVIHTDVDGDGVVFAEAFAPTAIDFVTHGCVRLWAEPKPRPLWLIAQAYFFSAPIVVNLLNQMNVLLCVVAMRQQAWLRLDLVIEVYKLKIGFIEQI